MEANGKPTVIFVCSGNSARSVAAEYLAMKHFGSFANFLSAGTNVRRDRPKEGVISALKDTAMLEIPDDIQCRRLFDLLDKQFPRDVVSAAGVGRLAAVIIMCCNAAQDCPQIEEKLPAECCLITEMVTGPMEMMQLCNLNGGCEERGPADEDAVYSDFVSNIDVWIQSTLPTIIPSIITPVETVAIVA